MSPNATIPTLVVLTLGSVLFALAQENAPRGSDTKPVPRDEAKDPADPNSAPQGSGKRDSRTDEKAPGNPGTKAESAAKDPAETIEIPNLAETDTEAETKTETAKSAAPPADAGGIRTAAIETRKLGHADEPVVTAPLCSLFVDDGDYFVLVRGDGSASDFTQIPVELGETDGFRVEITNGLAAGDEVIAVSTDQLPFPALPGDFAECEDGECELTDAACGPGGCAVGSSGTTLSADVLFRDAKFGPGSSSPGSFGPGSCFDGGPVGYCPPY